MANIDQASALGLSEPRRRNPLVKWGVIAIAALVLLGAVGGAWYFLLGGREHLSSRQAREVETPLPFFLEVKPIVVTMQSSGSASHFVQIGASLQLPHSASGEMVTALLPEIQDTMRQTLLNFKIDDLQSPEGVNRVRKVMTQHLNDMLVAALGRVRIAKITDGSSDEPLVQNILFPTLIVE